MLLFPVVYFLRIKVPLGISIVYLLAFLFFLISLGDKTPIHYFLWKYFPLFQSFRVPGRITMMLPFLFTILLAWILNYTQEATKNTKKRSPVVTLSFLSIFVYIGGNYLLKPFHSEDKVFTPQFINPIPHSLDTALFLMGFLTLICLFFYSLQRNNSSKRFNVLSGFIILLVFSQTMIQMRFGTWVIPKGRGGISLETLDELRRESHSFFGGEGHGCIGDGLESKIVTQQIYNSFLEKKLAQFYRKWTYASSDIETYHLLAVRSNNDEAIIEDPLRSHRPALVESKDDDAIMLTNNTFNTLQFRLTNQTPGYFVSSYPFSDHWTVMVDNVRKNIKKTNGYLSGVYVDSGVHDIKFIYKSPASFWGMIISGFALFILMTYVFIATPFPTPVRVTMVACSFLFCLGGIYSWCNSLYSGDNLRTKYYWTSKDFPSSENIAFGKRTKMSSPAFRHLPFESSSGNGIDDDLESFFMTGVYSKHASWWEDCSLTNLAPALLRAIVQR